MAFPDLPGIGALLSCDGRTLDIRVIEPTYDQLRRVDRRQGVTLETCQENAGHGVSFTSRETVLRTGNLSE